MLRAGKSSRHRAAIDTAIPRLTGVDLPVRRSSGTAQADLWKDLGRPDLGDIVRRVCTVCGWTSASPGAGQTLAIASALEREGKSSVARAMAISMALDHDGDVLLLECDLLHPSLSRDFGADASPGLTETLSGEATFADALRQTSLPNLWLLPAGGNHHSPSRLLRSHAMSGLLQEARSRFAFIVVDLPAVLRSSDAAVLARLTDGVVLVVRAGATDQRAVAEAVGLLSGAPLHGVVLNRWRTKVPGIVRRLVEM
jgi:capsular exopolysaccharide synthesis family protein